MERHHTKELVRTSQAITPKAYISLALVLSVGSCDSPCHVVSGARLRESRSTLTPPSAVQAVERDGMDALPRPAMHGVPSLSTRMFVCHKR